MTDAPGPNYWREVQKRMAEGGAYDHGVFDSHLVDPPAPDAWDECGYCGHDRDDHDRLCDWPGCDCRGFVEEATA